jgi:ferritin
MLTQKVEKAFNEQVNAEMYSSYLYLSMSAHFASRSLNGFAHWMRMQADEESMHAMKFFDFILDRGGKPTLKAIEAPPADFGTPSEAFTTVLEHERKVTALIHGLVDVTAKEGDHASAPFLQWFVSEQIEEEKNAQEIVDQLKLVSDQPASLFMLDQMLGQRVAPAPIADQP